MKKEKKNSVGDNELVERRFKVESNSGRRPRDGYGHSENTRAGAVGCVCLLKPRKKTESKFKTRTRRSSVKSKENVIFFCFKGKKN